MTISAESIVVASPSQVSSELQDESVILDMESGTYYGLNEVGASIWAMIQEPQPVSKIQAAILAEYEVEAEQCAQDVINLLNQLLERGLVRIKDEAIA